MKIPVGKNGKKIDARWLLLIPVIVVAAIVVYKVFCLGMFSSGLKLGYVGSASMHKWTGTYAEIRGTFKHDMKPTDDAETIRAKVVCEKGSVEVLVEDYGGDVWFDRIVNVSEEFEIPTGGKRMTISLITDSHSGSFEFLY